VHRPVLVAVAVLVAACTDAGPAPPRQPPAIAVQLARAAHAPPVPVPWWWDGPLPPGRDACPQLAAGRLGDPGQAPISLAVVVIDADTLRLADQTLISLTAGAAPQTASEGSQLPALRAALAPKLERQRAFLAACDLPDAPIDLMLAVAPDAPQNTIMAALITARAAGVARAFLAVAGGTKGRTWTPGGFTPDEVSLALHRQGDDWTARIDARPLPGSPGASLAGLPAILGTRRPGCVNVEMRGDEAWAPLISALDVVAGLGAHQFSLTSAGPEPAQARTAAPPGDTVTLRAGELVAAFPLVPTQFIGVDDLDHLPPSHPCEALFVLRGEPPPP